MSTFLTVGADAAANLPPTRTPDQLSPDSTPGGPTRAVVRLAHCGHTAYRRCGLSPGTVLVRNNYSQFGFGGAHP